MIIVRAFNQENYIKRLIGENLINQSIIRLIEKSIDDQFLYQSLIDLIII